MRRAAPAASRHPVAATTTTTAVVTTFAAHAAQPATAQPAAFTTGAALAAATAPVHVPHARWRPGVPRGRPSDPSRVRIRTGQPVAGLPGARAILFSNVRAPLRCPIVNGLLILNLCGGLHLRQNVVRNVRHQRRRWLRHPDRFRLQARARRRLHTLPLFTSQHARATGGPVVPVPDDRTLVVVPRDRSPEPI